MLMENRRIFFFALAGGLLLWIADAAVDSLFFSGQTFLDSLILNPSAHELYFRFLFLFAFVVFAAVISRDWTRQERIQAELEKVVERLEQEKAKSEAVLTAIGDGISLQAPDLKVLYQNRVHKDMVGGDKAGQYCYQAYSARESVCPECPVVLTLADGDIHTVRKKLVRSSEDREIEIKSSPLTDQSGSIIGAIEAVRDITDRQKTVEKLRLFSTAIEVAIDGVQIVDLNGRVLYSNKAIQDIYGFSPEELQGCFVGDMNADKEYASRVILPSIRESGRWSGEMSVVHKNGHTFPIWLSTSLVTGEAGLPIAMIGIIRDITERKQAEEILNRHREHLVKLVQERTGELTEANEKLRKEISDREKMEEELVKAQKLESLGILAGGIAHDFNNLLASMLGNISLAMLDLDEGHPALSQLAAAEKASLRAQDLTRQLLTFSRGGAPVKKTTDLAELVREASGFALRGSRVRCELDVEEGLYFADVDESQISRVIHNLLINADHAMPQGGTVYIRCSNVRAGGGEKTSPLPEGNYVRITVQDHGVGIAREHLPKIFDPYFTTKQKGSGLGLATAYSIVRKHGGNITVESTLGSGTIFTVYLPASSTTMKAPKKTNNGIRSGKGSILVMDDEADVRETTGNVLMRLGYSVEFASDGQEAVERYRASHASGKAFDLVIMDLTVPGGMGGKEAIQKLREMDPEVKAIVASGYSNDPIMADFTSYGFRGAVEKPFRISDLSAEVHKVLNGGELRG